MPDKFSVGDHVSYPAGALRTHGVITEIISTDKRIGKKTVHASDDDHKYVVKNDNSLKSQGLKEEVLETYEDQK